MGSKSDRLKRLEHCLFIIANYACSYPYLLEAMKITKELLDEQ